eukprot:5637989-Pyramimonas_sp.AAC.1
MLLRFCAPPSPLGRAPPERQGNRRKRKQGTSYTTFFHAVLAPPTLAGRTRPSVRGLAIQYNLSGFMPLPHFPKGFARAPRSYRQRPRQSPRQIVRRFG